MFRVLVVALVACLASDGDLSAQDLVSHAAGCVQLEAPSGWHVAEVPVGREVRLVISPDETVETGRLPASGLWLTLHWPHHSEQDARFLRERLATRLRQRAGRDTQLQPPEELQIGQWSAVRQALDMPASSSQVEASGSAPGSPLGRQVQHLLISTPWYVLEIYAAAESTAFLDHKTPVGQVIRSLDLRQPPPAPVTDSERVQAAKDILGSWKAYRSRMKIHGDGRITIKLDRLQKASTSNEPQEPLLQEIVGKFEARDDLLLVKWEDGSRLNFRWRLFEGQLLLTDSDGQCSRLLPILE